MQRQPTPPPIHPPDDPPFCRKIPFFNVIYFESLVLIFSHKGDEKFEVTQAIVNFSKIHDSPPSRCFRLWLMHCFYAGIISGFRMWNSLVEKIIKSKIKVGDKFFRCYGSSFVTNNLLLFVFDVYCIFVLHTHA